MRFSNYQKAVHYLIHDIPKTSRNVFDDAKAIEKNISLMETLGNPQNKHSAVHVAGTSGKGTVCYLVDALLRAHSKTTGLTQSPHVYDIRERIQINGQLISEKKFISSLNAVLAAETKEDLGISYFEIITAMGFWLLAKEPIDYAIYETGMGGRLDASNVINREDKLCVLTKIGFDHTEALGKTLAKIASEKAGIIQARNHVVALRQEAEVTAAFETKCQAVGASIEWVEPGEDYQKTNDALAIRTCELLAKRDGWQFDHTLAEAVLAQVFIPGRFEKRHLKDHLVILDGAHNPQKLSALANRVIREEKNPSTVIFAAGERKDIEACIQELMPIAKRIIATEYFTNEKDIPIRPIATNVVAEICKKYSIETLEHKSPAEALHIATTFTEPILITGSFYLLSEVDGLF